MRVLAMLACMAMVMLAFHPARAQTHVQVLETWPAGDAVTLGKGQNFYLHLGYASDQPVRIWARPYFQGKPASAGSNSSRTYPAGSGEALGWFSCSIPARRWTKYGSVRVTVRTTARRWSRPIPFRSWAAMNPRKARRNPRGWPT